MVGADVSRLGLERGDLREQFFSVRGVGVVRLVVAEEPQDWPDFATDLVGLDPNDNDAAVPASFWLLGLDCMATQSKEQQAGNQFRASPRGGWHRGISPSR